jgi:hypothetical protein
MSFRFMPLAMLMIAMLTQSCSVILSTDATQCDIDEDCSTDAGGGGLACENHICVQSLVVNEIQAGSPDWAEIVNLGSTPLSLAGYKICDDHCFGTPADLETAVTFPPDLTLEPGEHFVIAFGVVAPMAGIVTDPQLCIGAPRCVHSSQGLGASADSVILFDPNDAVVDTHAWTVAVDGATTRCRTPDGTGAFVDACPRTPGESN